MRWSPALGGGTSGLVGRLCCTRPLTDVDDEFLGISGRLEAEGWFEAGVGVGLVSGFDVAGSRLREAWLCARAGNSFREPARAASVKSFKNSAGIALIAAFSVSSASVILASSISPSSASAFSEAVPAGLEAPLTLYIDQSTYYLGMSVVLELTLAEDSAGIQALWDSGS